MPKLERKADPPKKKEKAAKGVPVETQPKEKGAKQPKRKEAGAKDGNDAQKKEKKEKAPKEKGSSGDPGKKVGGGGKNAPAEDAGDPVPSMIDLRVGHIVDSKSLVC